MNARSDEGVRLIPDSEADEEYHKICRIYEGWAFKYGLDPYSSYKVVAVEIPLSRPILNPATGKPYCPEVYVIHEDDGSMRMASTNEVHASTGRLGKVRYPWYQVGRLDFVLQHRKTGALLVGEWKSSASPQTLIKGLTVDPQTDGYCWLLDHAVSIGLFTGKVKGYLYDVSSTSYQRDPQILKKGGLSKAKNKCTPSWRWMAQILALNLNPADYQEHIEWCRQRIDPKLYLRETGSSDPDARARYAEEVFSAAQTVAHKRRVAARAASDTDINVHFPRVPVCLRGGYCSFRGPCIEDGDEARASFTTSKGPIWTRC